MKSMKNNYSGGIFLTEELFLHDHYLKSCTARVKRVDGMRVVLDRTVFYPQGGGQPFDKGTITRNGEKFEVLSVRKENGEIFHELNKQGLAEGDSVECAIDWDYRYKLMRFHTSAHVLARVLSNETNSLITGNQLGAEESRMDFSASSFGMEQAKGFEEKANQVIAQNLPVTVSFEKAEDAFKRPELFRLKSVLPKNLSVLRIVSIGDFDVQADGGTHVANTSEIGRIRITRTENKGKENRRVYWRLE